MLDWKKRHDNIIRDATQHVCASRHFFRYFTSKAAAYRTIAKLEADGLLRLVGTYVNGDSGRPENVYCNSWRPKPDQIEHELKLSDALLCYPEADILRGWAVDKHLQPDGEMTLDGIFFNVELDTGKQTHSQVGHRQRRYAGSTDYLLYITLSDRRRDGLLKHADDAVKSIALFTTLAEVVRAPRGEIWIDCYGERTAI